MYKRLLNKSKQKEFDDSDSVSSQEEPRSVDDQEVSDEEIVDNDADIVENYEEQEDNRDFDITDPNLDVVTEEELTHSGKQVKGDYVCTLCPKKKLDSMLAVREHLQSKGHLKREQIAAKLVEEEEARMKAEKTKGKKQKKADAPTQVDASTASPNNTNKNKNNKNRQSDATDASENKKQSKEKNVAAHTNKHEGKKSNQNNQSDNNNNATKDTKGNKDVKNNKDTANNKAKNNKDTKANNDTAAKSEQLKRKRPAPDTTESEEQPHKKQKRVSEHQSPVSEAKKGKAHKTTPKKDVKNK